MRRLRLSALTMALGVALAWGVTILAQNWTVQNGSNAVTVSSPNTAVSIRQNGTGKILSLLSGATEVFSVALTGVPTITVPNLLTTSTDGEVFQNTTASNSTNTVQLGPRTKWCGTAYNSTSAGSETECFFIENLPATVAGTITGTFRIGFINNAGTVSYPFQMSSAGNGGIYSVSSTNASNYERIGLAFESNTPVIAAEAAGTGTLRDLYFRAGTGHLLGFQTGGANTRWQIDQNGLLLAGVDNTVDIGAVGANRPRAAYLAGPSITAGSGTGITVNDTGSVRTVLYKVTVASTAFICAAVTCDVTIGTLPADTHLGRVYAKLTTTFACASVCTTSTLSAVLGKGAGGAEYLASLDADAATAVFGDADAELGTLLVRAAAIQGGTYTTTSQAVVVRLTSGTGNIGTGAASNLSQGSITFYLSTDVLP